MAVTEGVRHATKRAWRTCARRPDAVKLPAGSDSVAVALTGASVMDDGLQRTSQCEDNAEPGRRGHRRLELALFDVGSGARLRLAATTAKERGALVKHTVDEIEEWVRKGGGE